MITTKVSIKPSPTTAKRQHIFFIILATVILFNVLPQLRLVDGSPINKKLLKSRRLPFNGKLNDQESNYASSSSSSSSASTSTFNDPDSSSNQVSKSPEYASTEYQSQFPNNPETTLDFSSEPYNYDSQSNEKKESSYNEKYPDSNLNTNQETFKGNAAAPKTTEVTITGYMEISTKDLDTMGINLSEMLPNYQAQIPSQRWESEQDQLKESNEFENTPTSRTQTEESPLIRIPQSDPMLKHQNPQIIPGQKLGPKDTRKYPTGQTSTISPSEFYKVFIRPTPLNPDLKVDRNAPLNIYPGLSENPGHEQQNFPFPINPQILQQPGTNILIPMQPQKASQRPMLQNDTYLSQLQSKPHFLTPPKQSYVNRKPSLYRQKKIVNDPQSQIKNQLPLERLSKQNLYENIPNGELRNQREAPENAFAFKMPDSSEHVFPPAFWQDLDGLML
ncbi:hypothetical protein G9A89_020473 [Geosiphon pyriformis]|nr:hypothetical protein G9A89_020473 [Geosiphon pyriformis]